MKRAVGLLILFAAVVVLGGCPRPQAVDAPQPIPDRPAVATPTPATAGEGVSGLALGKQIYDTGLGASGAQVPFTGGSDRFKQKPAGCAGCHGADGRGHEGRSPAVNYAALQEDFPGDAAVLAAIREGKEKNETLSLAMPRWQLTEAEGAALIEHLKALDKAPAADGKSAKPDSK